MRGGVRSGAGRPKSEDSAVVRVPAGCLDAVRSMIETYKSTGSVSFPSSRSAISFDWKSFDEPPPPGIQVLLYAFPSKGVDPSGVAMVYWMTFESDYVLKLISGEMRNSHGFFAWCVHPFSSITINPPPFEFSNDIQTSLQSDNSSAPHYVTPDILRQIRAIFPR